MALSVVEYPAVVFLSCTLFTCIQSVVERFHLNSVKGCGSRCASGSLHNFSSCRGVTEDLSMAGRICASWGLQKMTVLMCKLVFESKSLPKERSPKTGKNQETTDLGVCSVPLSSWKEHVAAPWPPLTALECFSTVDWKTRELVFCWWLKKACFLLLFRSNYSSCEIPYAAFWKLSSFRS